MIACEEATAVGEEEEEGAFGCCGDVFLSFLRNRRVFIAGLSGSSAALRAIL